MSNAQSKRRVLVIKHDPQQADAVTMTPQLTRRGVEVAGAASSFGDLERAVPGNSGAERDAAALVSSAAARGPSERAR
jgi:hypothetical protein